MWSPSTLAALLIVLVPLDAFPSSEYARQYLGQNYDCGPTGDCEISARQSRGGGMFDSLSAGGTFGLAKRLESFRFTNRDDSLAKRRGAALDSLVAGGMFGKAAKRNDYDYQLGDNGRNRDKFQRNVRPLNTMELGGSFGRAIKRFSLDSLGNNAFGVEKRKADGNTDQELKAFLNKSSGNENTHRQQHNTDTYRTPGYYLKFIPSYTSSYSEPKYDQLIQ